MRTIHRLALLLLSAFAGSARAADVDPAGQRLDRSSRYHEWIEVKTPAGRIGRAIVVYPQADTPAPGVLVIHEDRRLTATNSPTNR